MIYSKISALVSKKIGGTGTNRFSSYSISLGGTAILEGEQVSDAYRAMVANLKALVNEELKSPRQKAIEASEPLIIIASR